MLWLLSRYNLMLAMQGSSTAIWSITAAVVALVLNAHNTTCRTDPARENMWQANEVLFVDAEHDNEVLTFREVFLGSRALELLVAGCAP